MNQNLVQYARQLRLSGLLASLELRLVEARTHQLPHEQFLELAFQDELNVRQQRVIDKRTKAAGFRDHKTLEDFDWTFNPHVSQVSLNWNAGDDFRIEMHRRPPLFQKCYGRCPDSRLARTFCPFFRRF
jgi:DNA replication protein DnaC